jgi:hypothetical protein
MSPEMARLRRSKITDELPLSGEERLAHLYCGHLGTPNDKWWPDRRGLPHAAREFEAESVCYLVCERLGITNPSDEYLAGYLGHDQEIPPISLDCVMKTAGLIERMGRERLGARKEKKDTI